MIIIRVPHGRWRLFFLFVLLGVLFYPTLITSLSTVHRNGAGGASQAEMAERNALAQRQQPALVIQHAPAPTPSGTLLVSTLDGQLHALDLRSGDYLWSFGAGGAAGSGMLSSTDSRFGTSGGSVNPAASSDAAEWSDSVDSGEEEDADDPESVRRILQRELNADLASHDLVFDQDDEQHSAHPHRRHHQHAHSRPAQAQPTASSKGPARRDTSASNSSAPLMIPGVDGSLFYSGAHGLQRLPINVAELVDAAPFRTGDNTRYLGYKEVNVFLIDRNSGALRRVFSPRSAAGKAALFESCEDDSCDPALVWVAKTDLTVHALDGRSGRLRWNVSMSVFGPFDSPERLAQLSEAALERLGVPSIAASVDGTVHALDVAGQRVHWAQPLHSPVTAVFLVRPSDTLSVPLEDEQADDASAGGGRAADMIRLPHFYFNVPEADQAPPREHQQQQRPPHPGAGQPADPLMSELIASYYYARDGAERLQYTYVGRTDSGLIYALPNPAPVPARSKIAMLIDGGSGSGGGGSGGGRGPLAIAGGSSAPSSSEQALAAAAAQAAGHRPSAGRPNIPAVGHSPAASDANAVAHRHGGGGGNAAEEDEEAPDASCVPSSSSYPQCLVGFHALAVSPASSASAAARDAVHGHGSSPPQLPAAVDFYNQILRPPSAPKQPTGQGESGDDEEEDATLLLDGDDYEQEDDAELVGPVTGASAASIPAAAPGSKRPAGGGKKPPSGWWTVYPSGFFESLLYFWPLVTFTLVAPVVLSVAVVIVWSRCIGEDRRRSWGDATRQKLKNPWGGGQQKKGGAGGGGVGSNGGGGSNKQHKHKKSPGGGDEAHELEGEEGTGSGARRRRDRSQRASLQRQNSGEKPGTTSSMFYGGNGTGEHDASPAGDSPPVAPVPPRKTHWSTYETVVSHFNSLSSYLPTGLRRHQSESSATSGGSASSQSSGDKGLRPRKHILSRPDAAKLNSDAASQQPALVRSYSSPQPNADGSISIGRMVLFPSRVLGTGSMGTVVYGGTFEGRPCAIKRMVKEFFGSANAAQEISLLIQSDTHPNVLRYYAKDEDGSFIYLALELCVGTIQDLVDGTAASAAALAVAAAAAGNQQLLHHQQQHPPQHQLEETIEILHGLMVGLAHLHRLHIVHRDLKPANILLTAKGIVSTHTETKLAHIQKTVKLADMGLGKQLSLSRSSFDSVVSGSVGWQPPETMCLPLDTELLLAHSAQRIPVRMLKEGQWIAGQDGQAVRVEAAVHLREPYGLYRMEHSKETGVEAYHVTPNHRVTLRACTSPRVLVSAQGRRLRIRFQRAEDGLLTERALPLPAELGAAAAAAALAASEERMEDFSLPILEEEVIGAMTRRAYGEGAMPWQAALCAFAAQQLALLPRESYLCAGQLFDLPSATLFQLQEALRIGRVDALVAGRRVPLPEPWSGAEGDAMLCSNLAIATGAGRYEAFDSRVHQAHVVYLLLQPSSLSEARDGSASCKPAALVQLQQVQRALGLELAEQHGLLLLLAQQPVHNEHQQNIVRKVLQLEGVRSLVLFGADARQLLECVLDRELLQGASFEPLQRDGVQGIELPRSDASPPLQIWFARDPCQVASAVSLGRTLACAHDLPLPLDALAEQRLSQLASSDSLPLRRLTFVPGAVDVVSVTVSGARDEDRRFALASGVLTHNSNGGRLTKAVDVFSAGVVMHYVLTRGVHPFGEPVERELNIAHARMDLSALSGLPEARDLIGCCIHPDPALRLSADDAVAHPFFWPAAKQLQFLLEASDRFESELPHSELRMCLEAQAAAVVGANWAAHLDQALVDNLGQYRKYNTASVRDCLRVIRNKKNHYRDLPVAVRAALGPLPHGFLRYFTSRFPALLVYVYSVLACFALESPASSPGDPCSYSPLDADTDYTRAALSAEAAAAAAAGTTGGSSGAGVDLSAASGSTSSSMGDGSAERFEAMAAFYNKPLRAHPQLRFSSLPLQPFFQDISLRRLVQLQKHTRLRFRHWYVREEQWMQLPHAPAATTPGAGAAVRPTHAAANDEAPWPVASAAGHSPSASPAAAAAPAAVASGVADVAASAAAPPAPFVM